MMQEETQAAEPQAEVAESISAFKGFDKNMKCRDYQFEVGKTYTHDGEVAACKGGFHSCENPLDVFAYYAPGESRFAAVEQSGDISRHESDSKIASRSIHIKAELNIPMLISAAFDFVVKNCKPAESQHATGNSSASSATGYSSASSATGYRSASSATGDLSASSATGYRSASSATGDHSASSATGDYSASSATGDYSASSATGNSSASSATGDLSASSATGYSSASSATGDHSASSATGDYSASSATGYRSASLTTGWRSSSEIKQGENTKPLNAIAIAAGGESKARAPAGSAIVLCYRNGYGEIIHIRASKIGDNGTKPDAWYSLNEAGEFVEVEL